jgi:hypothetical protein
MSATPATTTTASPAPPAQQPMAPAPPETSGIPGFEKMSFAQQRYAQDQIIARRNQR